MKTARVGKALRFYRKKQRLSQTALSLKVRIPQTTISDFENDKYLPDILQAIRLANALQISIYDLAFFQKQKTKVS